MEELLELFDKLTIKDNDMESSDTKTKKTKKQPIWIIEDDEPNIEEKTKHEMNNINVSKIKKIKKKPIWIIEEDEPNIEEKTKQPKILTEDLGKIFEMAICLLYEIEYDGKYKYSLEEAINIKDKLYKLKNVFPFKIKHIAKNGNKYDFVSIDNNEISKIGTLLGLIFLKSSMISSNGKFKLDDEFMQYLLITY